MATIKDKTTEALQQELAQMREALRVFRFGGAGSRSRNVREGRNLRKDIARILTELSARSLDAARDRVAKTKK
jgi:ribosomal protein L29